MIRRGMLVVYIVFILFFLFSCHQHPVVEGKVLKAGELLISVENFDADVGRYFAPTPLGAASFANSPNYTFTLTATNGRVSLPPQRVTLDAAGVGVVSDIPDGTWSLTLTVRGKNDYNTTQQNVDLFKGDAVVTVKDGRGSPVTFTLISQAAGTGQFSLDLTLNLEDVDFAYPYPRRVGSTLGIADFELKYGLFTLGTDTLLHGNGFNRRRGYQQGAITAGPWRQNWNNVPAGRYDLGFYMMGGMLPVTAKKYYWKLGEVIIEPGRTTSAVVTVPRFIFLPAAPASFRGAASASGSDYATTLSWEGVYNSERYELQILQYPSTTTSVPADDAAWTSLAGNSASRVFTYNAIAGDPNRFTLPNHPAMGIAGWSHWGSLEGGSKNFGINITPASGKSYTARLRAQNGFGYSAWKYLGGQIRP